MAILTDAKVGQIKALVEILKVPMSLPITQGEMWAERARAAEVITDLLAEVMELQTRLQPFESHEK